MGVLAMVFVIFMHRENLKRLWRNEESKLDLSKFKRKKKSASEPAVSQPTPTAEPSADDEKEQDDA